MTKLSSMVTTAGPNCSSRVWLSVVRYKCACAVWHPSAAAFIMIFMATLILYYAHSSEELRISGPRGAWKCVYFTSILSKMLLAFKSPSRVTRLRGEFCFRVTRGNACLRCYTNELGWRARTAI